MGNESQTFTRQEAMQIAAQEVAKQQMTGLKDNMIVMSQSNSTALAEINVKITQIFTSMVEQNREQKEDRDKLIGGLKLEIEKEFASKIDVINISNRLDQLWIKISAVILTATTIGGIVGWVISTIVGFKNVMQ